MADALDGDQYDREYNPRILVPEASQYFDEWRARGAAARASSEFQPDIAYGTAANERLDFFPAGVSDPPLVVFIHGGYWRALDKADFSWVAPGYVAAGCSVAVLNYGLAPATPLVEIVNQVRRACAWLYGRAGDLQFDRDRIFVTGHSAGGHLTAMLLATDWPAWNRELPSRLIAGALAVSGLFDLEPLLRASFLRADIRLNLEEQRQLSPVNLRPRNEAPLVLAVGALESAAFHGQSAALANRWPAVVQGPPFSIEGRNHFSVCDDFADSDGQLFGTMNALVCGDRLP